MSKTCARFGYATPHLPLAATSGREINAPREGKDNSDPR